MAGEAGFTTDDNTARALAAKAFEPRRGTTVYVDTWLRAPGSVQLGTDAHHLDVPAVLVFRDEMPGANWMHPCSYALVDPDTGAVLLRVSSDRPPAFGRLPPSWRLVSDPDGLGDLIVE